MEVLRVLAAAHPATVRRAELIDAIWDGNYLVGDPALTKEVCWLREALGDDPKSPRLIKTFPRQGYALLRPLVRLGVKAAHRRIMAPAAGIVLAIVMTAATLTGVQLTQGGSAGDGSIDPVLEKARYLIDQGGKAERDSAERILRQALEHRPEQPALLAMLASVLLEGQPGDEAWSAARQLAAQSLALRSDQLDALLVLGRIKLFRDWDWQEAAQHIQHALQVAPNDPRPHLLHSAWLSSLARYPESLEAGQRALALDPVSPHVRGDLAWVAFVAERHPDAEQYTRALLELEPASTFGKHLLAKILFATGRGEEGCAVLAELAAVPAAASAPGSDCLRAYLRHAQDRWQRAPSSPLRSVVLASIASELGDADAAFAHLDDAVAGRSLHVPFLAVDPDFAALHGDSRWRELLRSTGHPLSSGSELFVDLR